ncbi:MAG: hypothetical protein A3G30_05625, partial [Chlamydiae bacterium RIFCSPLOWO2_12_FULL_49_12]
MFKKFCSKKTMTTDRIVLEPFQKKCGLLFQEEKRLLKEIFRPEHTLFFHIGSTAIPGCLANPILDILAVVFDIGEVDLLEEALREAGYELQPECGINRRRLFQKKREQEVHLHCFEESHPDVGRHLRFRNYLFSHPGKVKEYSALKKKLLERFVNEPSQYVWGKSRWIKQIDCLAAFEARSFLKVELKGERKSLWQPSEIIEAMEDNLYLEMMYFAHYIPTREILFNPDVTVLQSTISDDTFNCILRARFDEKSVGKRVAQVLSCFEEKNLPLTWWTGPRDTPAQLPQVLEEMGLCPQEENVGMYLDLQTEVPEDESALSVKRVLSGRQLFDYDSVHVRSEGNLDVFEQFWKKTPPLLYGKGAPVEMYVGYAKKEPVVTGLLVFYAHAAGIYYIMTLPKERRKGYGTAMMCHLLQRAREKGYFLSVLQASKQGKGLYARLGFLPCSLFVEYK